MNKQVSNIRKAFTNGSIANIIFSTTQLSNIPQSGGVLGIPFRAATKN